MQNRETICEKHFYLPRDTVKTEQWLNAKAKQGFRLVRAEDYRFYFEKTEPFSCRYFLMNPDSGKNSEWWVFSEFSKLAGYTVPTSGTPRLVLYADEEQLELHRTLIDYYFACRNYRLARRMGLWCLVFAVLCVLSLGLGAIGSWGSGIRVLPYAAATLAFSAWFGFSLSHFAATCRESLRDLLKRPHRPGY